MGAGEFRGMPFSIPHSALVPPRNPPTTTTLFNYQGSIIEVLAKWVLDPNTVGTAHALSAPLCSAI